MAVSPHPDRQGLSRCRHDVEALERTLELILTAARPLLAASLHPPATHEGRKHATWDSRSPRDWQMQLPPTGSSAKHFARSGKACRRGKAAMVRHSGQAPSTSRDPVLKLKPRSDLVTVPREQRTACFEIRIGEALGVFGHLTVGHPTLDRPDYEHARVGAVVEGDDWLATTGQGFCA